MGVARRSAASVKDSHVMLSIVDLPLPYGRPGVRDRTVRTCVHSLDVQDLWAPSKGVGGAHLLLLGVLLARRLGRRPEKCLTGMHLEGDRAATATRALRAHGVVVGSARAVEASNVRRAAPVRRRPVCARTRRAGRRWVRGHGATVRTAPGSAWGPGRRGWVAVRSAPIGKHCVERNYVNNAHTQGAYLRM